MFYCLENFNEFLNLNLINNLLDNIKYFIKLSYSYIIRSLFVVISCLYDETDEQDGFLLLTFLQQGQHLSNIQIQPKKHWNKFKQTITSNAIFINRKYLFVDTIQLKVF